MKKRLANKKGMTLPALLAIVTVMFSLAFSVLSYMVFQANLVEKNIRFSEEYTNSTTQIKAIQHIIQRDELSDLSTITAIAAYFNIQVEAVTPSVYRFYKPLDAVSRTVSGYLAPETTVVSTYEEVFTFSGVEDTFQLSPLINATTMLAAFSEEYLVEQFPSIVLDGDFSTFQGIIDYYRSITDDYYTLENPSYLENQVNPYVNDFIFIDGDVDLSDQDLTIADGYVLVIDGNLTTDGDTVINGNIIINGNLIFDGKNRTYREVNGTFYVSGDVSITRNSDLGTSERPTFVITNGTAYVDNQVNVYGFFIAFAFDGNTGNTFVEGGVYTIDEANVKNANVTPNTTLENSELYGYAVSTTIIVESEGGDTTYTMTEPRLE